MLSLQNVTLSIDDKPIVHDISLELSLGRVHAIMGPNGSGKSTLVNGIMATGLVEITNGTITFDGVNITDLPAYKRAQHGMFVSFQQPPAIPGLRVFTLLKEMRQALSSCAFDLEAFTQEIKQYLTLLSMDHSFLERSCNDGFSGGEKKRFELLQLLVAQPKLVILDEIDSGLDIDALKLVAQVIHALKQKQPDLSVLIITHYNRLLEYVSPDTVHVLVNGRIVQTSDASLVQQLEQTGYAKLL